MFNFLCITIYVVFVNLQLVIRADVHIHAVTIATPHVQFLLHSSN